MIGKSKGAARLRRWPMALAISMAAAGMVFISSVTSVSEQKATVIPRPVLSNPEPIVSIAQGKDYAKTVKEAMDKAGGLGTLVKQGSKVFIKVNIVGAAPSGGGKVTDYRVAKAVVAECRRLGASEVIIGESPVDGSGMGGFAAAGYTGITGATLMDTNVPVSECRYVIPEKSMLGQPMYLPKAYMDADVVIDIPVMKIHGAAGVTLGLKNVGIGMPPKNLYTTSRGSKWALHDLGMNKVITEVNLLRRPDFTVIDGMVAGEGEGPNDPDPVQDNIVIASRDTVAADTIGTLAMGVNPEQIAMITYASYQGIGVSDTSAIKVVGKPLKAVRKDFVRPTPYGHPYKRTAVLSQAPETTVIDGVLTEWQGALQNRIGDETQYPQDSGRKGWRDSSARTMVMHDLSNIYFAYKVNDDILVKPKSFANISDESGDGVELLLGFDMPFLEDVQENLKTRNGHTKGKDFVLLAGYSDKVSTLIDNDTGKSVPGSEVAFVKTAEGYTVEGRLALSSIGRRALKEREEFWIDFAVADTDKPGEYPLKGIWNDGSMAMQYDSPALLGRAFVDPLTPGGVPAQKKAEVKLPMHPFISLVNASTPPADGLSLFWVGQAGYIIKGNGKTAYVDPYLSDSCGEEYRIFPIPVDPASVTNADIVLSSHPHTDHYDDLTIPPLMDSSPQATLVLAEKVRVMKADTLSGDALVRTKTIKVGQTLDLGGLTVTAVQAKHEQFTDPQTGYQNLGFILDFGGLVVYHSGDSLYWPQMADAVRKGLGDRRIDVMLIPINGKWGNMTHTEAAKLTSELKPELAIPMHYGTLSNNTVEPQLYVDALKQAAPTQAYRVMEPNKEFIYRRK